MAAASVPRVWRCARSCSTGSSNEVSVMIGYPFKSASGATAEVGTAKFAMYSKDGGAWIKDLANEEAIEAGEQIEQPDKRAETVIDDTKRELRELAVKP